MKQLYRIYYKTFVLNCTRIGYRRSHGIQLKEKGFALIGSRWDSRKRTKKNGMVSNITCFIILQTCVITDRIDEIAFSKIAGFKRHYE